VKRVPWLKADNSRIPPGSAPPNPSYPFTAAERVKSCLKKHSVVLGCGVAKIDAGDGEVWDW
jgi:hypothetical protein